jgi:three-Cys-motif partner protein
MSGNDNSKNLNDLFFDNPDQESLAKTGFVSYYLSLYLEIISRVRDSIQNKWGLGSCSGSNAKPRIDYIDLFSGPGKYKDGRPSVPLNIVKSVLCNPNPIENVHFYFNDATNAKKLEKNMLSTFGWNRLPDSIEIHSQDSRNINISELLNKNDIVLSYIDSFSDLLTDVGTIAQLITPNFSDCVLFINMTFFNRFCGSRKGSKPEKNFIRFFGSEEHLREMQDRKRRCQSVEQFAEVIIKDFVKRLQNKVGKRIYALPIFFLRDGKNSHVAQFILILSKSPKGAKTAKESFDPTSSKEKTSSNKKGFSKKCEGLFHVQEGKILIYDENEQMNLLADWEEKQEYELLTPLIPKGARNALNLDQFADKVDDNYMSKHGFLSGYSKKRLRKMLTYYEEQGNIAVVTANPNKMRRRGTWGSETKFYWAEKEDHK